MQSASSPTPHPASLAPGTVVGHWRVVEWAGRGVYGTVYRAVPVDAEHAPAVALKLALHPGDRRFAREMELLSRPRHPSIPRLVDCGSWQYLDGAQHPYLTMEWVEGVSLYDWARQDARSAEQVLGLLAQLAGALADVHAHGGIHRDVKGNNVLVRSSDGRAMLLDFGMGLHSGATTLTPPGMYPGTPMYRAPEASAFELRFFRDRSVRYSASPADDIYALGVTACRLATGEYPQFADPWKDEHGTWNLGALILPPKLRHTDLRLRQCIERMLSATPEERGTAAQLAEALGQAAKLPTPANAALKRPKARKSLRPWLTVVTVVLVLGTWVRWLVSAEPVVQPVASRAAASKAGQQDAGTAGLGDTAATTSMKDSPNSSLREVMAGDSPPEPLPGQAVPDTKGRCPRLQQVTLNGGCWGLVSKEPEACADLGGQMYQGTCYIPIFQHPHGRPRPRTSSPTKRAAPR